ncbi:hypothetical protein Tco_1367557 [Tanacetum coccineum]
MESQLQTTQTVSVLKLPVLKTGDYDLWSMRMEQYLTHSNYALWEVIVNGDALVVSSASAEGPIPPKTAEQKLARKNVLKPKSTLLLAIPDEHLLKFHEIKDAKTLWEAIKARNKSDLDTISIDDLYNNLKVYEAEIKSQSSSSSNSQNVAFVSSENTNNTNEVVNTAHEVSIVSSQGQASSSTYADDVMFSFFINQSNSPQLDNEDLKQIDTDDLEEMDLKWHVAMLTMRVKRFLKKIRRNLNFNGKETVSFDKTKVECYNTGEVTLLENAGHQLIRGIEMEILQEGFYQAEEGPTDFALMACLSLGSSSSSSSNTEYDQQRDSLKKSNLEIIGYELGLESLEARIVAGSGPEWLFDIDSLTKSMNYEPEKAYDHEYILLPLMLSNSSLSSSSQSIDTKDANEEVDIIKKTENQAKMTKLSMEWKRLCKIKAKVQKCQSQSQYRRISSQTGAGTEEYY